MRQAKRVACILAMFGASSAQARQCGVTQGDSDGDCVSDSDESFLLERFAPIWKADAPGARPPLPVEWWVRHCDLDITNLLLYSSDGYNGRSVYLEGPGRAVCETNGIQLTVEFLNSVFVPGSNFTCAGLGSTPPYYLLDARSDQFRSGNDPSDPITWGVLNAQGRGLYGRVTRWNGMNESQYLVQYFLFFGLNSTDVPTGNLGYHEGDWICVEFEVFWEGATSPRIERAVYNNHGRKIYIDSPAGLDFESGRPVVYMESNSQEAVPWPGNCGFDPQEPVPACVGTNTVNGGFEVLGYRIGAECEDFQVVREHRGQGEWLTTTSVKNLGEREAPNSDAEATFIQTFAGRYGWYAEDRFCAFGSCTGRQISVASPTGPPFQSKMWDREGLNDSRNSMYPGCSGLPSAHASPQGSADPNGNPSRPFRGLPEALPVVAAGGQVVLAPGTYQGDITIRQPVTITASGGSATIGP